MAQTLEEGLAVVRERDRLDPSNIEFPCWSDIMLVEMTSSDVVKWSLGSIMLQITNSFDHYGYI